MNAISFSVCVALGFVAAGCGGATAIGEAGPDDVRGGGAMGNGGDATAGTGTGGSNTPAGAAAGGKGTPAGAGTSSGGAATAASPCAVLQMAGQECVAAHKATSPSSR